MGPPSTFLQVTRELGSRRMTPEGAAELADRPSTGTPTQPRIGFAPAGRAPLANVDYRDGRALGQSEAFTVANEAGWSC
jgi:hypothetical protein